MNPQVTSKIAALREAAQHLDTRGDVQGFAVRLGALLHEIALDVSGQRLIPTSLALRVANELAEAFVLERFGDGRVSPTTQHDFFAMRDHLDETLAHLTIEIVTHNSNKKAGAA
jgi:hypothetical protein